MVFKYSEEIQQTIKDEIKFIHRGMAFTKTGAERGYLLVFRYPMLRLYAITNWDFHYLLYAENNPDTCCLNITNFSATAGVSETGRSYKYKFNDGWGEQIYIE